MATDIIMPQLGESIAEGTVVKWLVPLGGTIEKDQSLVEVETEKVDLEVPSPATGVLNEILVKAGETVAVGTLLARIDSLPSPSEVIHRVGGVVVRPVDPGPHGEEHHSPAVRQLAKEHEVDLSQVKGTGTGRRRTALVRSSRMVPAPCPAQTRTPPADRMAVTGSLPVAGCVSLAPAALGPLRGRPPSGSLRPSMGLGRGDRNRSRRA